MRFMTSAFLATSLLLYSVTAGAADNVPPYIGKHVSTPQDTRAKFYNVKITQDGNVAWVMFDYEFVREGKTQNYGIETWQMMKVGDD